MIDRSKYSHDDIVKFFGCSLYLSKKAAELSKDNFHIPEKKQTKRERLDVPKCEHFLHFLFSSGMIQDVAYGSKKLKFDSGEIKELPRAILTCKYSHAIATYMNVCEQAGYEPISESSLWRILNQIKPS